MAESRLLDILKNRYKMQQLFKEKNISLDTVSRIARLFRPITRRNTENGQEMAELLAKEINVLLNDTISEEQLIQRAMEISKEILKCNPLAK